MPRLLGDRAHRALHGLAQEAADEAAEKAAAADASGGGARQGAALGAAAHGAPEAVAVAFIARAGALLRSRRGRGRARLLSPAAAKDLFDGGESAQAQFFEGSLRDLGGVL